MMKPAQLVAFTRYFTTKGFEQCLLRAPMVNVETHLMAPSLTLTTTTGTQLQRFAELSSITQ
jgi:hypothetical protein